MKITRKEYTDRREKRSDFIIGFVGWLLGNAILAGIIFLGLSAINTRIGEEQLVTLLVGCCQLFPLLANLGALVYLSVARKWIALGMLSAIGILLALAVLLGIISAVACFVGARTF